MSRSYPIWNEVEACIYKGGKSYGARDTGAVNVYVGTSASNSEFLVSHAVTRREKGPYTVFTFYVDQKPVKRKWMHTKSRTWTDVCPVEAAQLMEVES